MATLPPALEHRARSQAGVLSRSQLLGFGLTPAQIRARMSSGRWQRLHPGVVATFTGTPSRAAALWAAALYAGEGATLSHLTAAELHGLVDESGDVVHVTVPVERGVTSRRGVRIHCAHRLPESRLDARAPAVVNVDDTVLDLVDAATRPRQAIDWVTRACQRRRTTPARLRTALARRKKIRWRAMVEAALADVASGAETPLELAYLRRVERSHHLPMGTRQRHLRSGRRSQWIDVDYAEFAVRVELDGRVGHVEDGMFRDRRRDNTSTLEGFATLRFGWVDVYHDTCATAGQVGTLLMAHGWVGQIRACGPSCRISLDVP